jgi:dihydrodipicolinate synthase/N-acetylneuraminate lyase
MQMTWQGVMPAITTEFKPDLSIDHHFVGRHCTWMLDTGCSGIVTPGSLGEGATLTFDEKSALWKTCVSAVGSRGPVIAAISSLSTDEAVALARVAQGAGCQGLMVLPPYVYKGDWRETKGHVTAILRATNVPCILYNNPIAYGTDFLPEQIEELARECPNLQAVKDSSGDVRRLTAIRALSGDRLALCVGLDDAIVEGVRAGAVGWIGGLTNALPKESVKLFQLAQERPSQHLDSLQRWFLPLLRLDTVPKFVQLIKLVQQELGHGSARVRPPRLELSGSELDQTLRMIRDTLRIKPAV